MFDSVTEGIKRWVIGLFASAIKHTSRAEDRVVGLEAWATRKSNDFGVDGFAIHSDGLIIVQCKRNSADNKVGRPTIQQFKGVAEEQNAYRGYFITTSAFTEDAIASAALTEKIILVGMDHLVRWHAEPPTFCGGSSDPSTRRPQDA
jgi:hypothetical protein